MSQNDSKHGVGAEHVEGIGTMYSTPKQNQYISSDQDDEQRLK